jgi:small redox-active disulfide protein 2
VNKAMGAVKKLIKVFMKIIKIYGSGCSTCHKLKVLVEKIVSENNIVAEVQYSNNFAEMAKLGILVVPAIVIDGQVKSSGVVPKRDEILRWLR